MSYSSAVLADSPSRYYRLQDALTDEQGGASMVLGGSPRTPVYATGIVDTSPRGLSFDGSDHAYVPSIAWGANKLTITFWANFTSFPDAFDPWLESSTDYNGGGLGDGRFLVYSDSSHMIVSLKEDVGLGSDYDVSVWPLPSTGANTHVAIVVDKTQSTTNRVKVYFNGAAQTLNGSGNSWASSTGNFSTQDMYVFGRTATYGQVGLIDDVALWAGTTLSAATIAAHYAAATTSPAQISGSSSATASGSLSLSAPSPGVITGSSSAAATGTLALTANQRVPFGSSAATATGSLDLTTTSATGSRAALGWLGWFITDTGGSSIPLIAGGSTAVATGSLSLTVPSTALISGSSTATATGTLLLRSSTETRIATPTSLGSTQFSNSTLSSVQFGNSTVQPAADHPVS